MGTKAFTRIKSARIAPQTVNCSRWHGVRTVSSSPRTCFPRLLALSSAAGPGLILFRGVSYPDAEMCELLERALSEVSPATLESSMCVVDKKRMCLTRLPLHNRS